jgi:hypothetical protein
MITKILFGLIAVVVLIVIIGGAALHFLRADDSDTFDDMPGEPSKNRRPAADPRDHPAEPEPAHRGRSRGREQARDQQWAAADRAGRPPAERAAPGYREPESLPRPATAERRGSQAGQRPTAPANARPGAGPRTAKPARPAAAAADSSSWDALSDVDYWAELAADKPFNAAEANPSPRNGSPARDAIPVRRGAEQKADARALADSRRAAAASPDAAQLPSRSRQPRRTPASRTADSALTQQMDTHGLAARYPAEPTTESIAALARLGGQQAGSAPRPAQRPASAQRPSGGQRPPAARPAGGQRPAVQSPAPSLPAGGPGRPSLPMDDDPLTSPSFPAINTSDSRSYRTRQAGGAASNGHSGNFSEPTQQYTQYPAAANRPASMPNGYPVPPTAARAVPVPPAAPVANPYGSYVSAPTPAYPEQAPASPPDYGSYPQSPAAAGYGGPASGYLPAPGNGHNGAGHANGLPGGYGADNGLSHDSYHGAGYNGAGYAGSVDSGGAYDTGYSDGGYPEASYNGATHNGAGYPGDYQPALYQATAYPASPAAQPGYGQPAQYDPRGYGAPDLAYGQDGYQGYQGYGGGTR